MSKEKKILILFYKYPEPGKVKTRLAETLGEDAALGIYRCMLLDLHERAESLPVEKISICSTSDNRLPRDRSPGVQLQKGDTLGERMYNAFSTVFSMGYEKALLVGSDCPELSKDILSDGFESLETCDYVLGPSLDGGYYLIGMRKEVLTFSIFDSIPWSSETVLEKTIEKISRERGSFRLLPELNDIDTIEDLTRYYEKSDSNRHSHTLEYLEGIREVHHEI